MTRLMCLVAAVLAAALTFVLGVALGMNAYPMEWRIADHEHNEWKLEEMP